MDNLVNAFKNAFSDFSVAKGLEIVLVFALSFIIIKFLIDNNAKLLLSCFLLVVIAVSLIFILNSSNNITLYVMILSFLILFIVIIYAREFKRMTMDVSFSDMKRFKDNKSNSMKSANEVIDEIIISLQNLSKNNIGALLILADNNMPSSVLESGVLINSEISSELIESVFYPKTPLHDGALIIKGKEIKYAGCFLPLSQKLNIPKDLGTRHRAGIGITETINVTSLIVSEETGIISIAKGGKIERYADADKLREILSAYYKLELISER